MCENLTKHLEDLEKSLEEKNNRFFKRTFKKELLFKILVIGDYGVGKTSIIRRYAEGTFHESYKITIGADFAIKSLEWDENTRINLQLWDIAGNERFGALTGVYYRYAAAAAIVFDLTRPETFKSVEKWLLDLRRKINLPMGQTIPVIILANKGDVTIATLPQQIVSFCDKYNILAWFITSAKDNVHIDEAMITLISAALENHHNLQIRLPLQITPETIQLNGEVVPKEKKGCCENLI